MEQGRRLPRRTGVRRLIPRYSLLLVVLELSLIFLTVLVAAADSDLDPTFDGDGIVTTDHNEFDQINDIVIQPDGKIVAAGHSGILHGSIQQPLGMMIARYNIDGSLDSSFGNGGIVTTAVGEYARALAVAVQADGRIVAAGRGGTLDQASFTVVRYNSNGSLDATFGSGGIVITPIGNFSQVGDVAIQADGKIVVTGDATGPGASFTFPMFTLARYNADGSLDATFDGDGVSQAVPAGLPSSPTEIPLGLAVQTDQKLAVAGVCIVDFRIKFCLSRYNSDGSLDNTFDSDGLVVTEFEGSRGGLAEGLQIQPDGKIVAAGQIFGDSGNFPALARYNTDGSLDITFDGDGMATLPNSVNFRVENLALQPNGKIVIVGDGFFSAPVFNSVLALARFDADGSIDETFGNGGIVTTSIGTSSGGTTVAAQADGRIVAGGFGNLSFEPDEPFATFSDFALARYGDAVNDAPVLTITGPPSGSAFALETPVNFTGTFTDDPGDTHFVEWFFESLTQPGIIVVPMSGAPPGSADTAHTFTEPGVYKVSLRVVDNNFLSGIATTVNGVEALVVIFNPDGPRVSGGGWIDSAPGALVALPNATGKANFAFVAKYHNGAGAPTGNTHFRFNAGGLNFQSKGHEWLVVSGRKALCKGAGTINGNGDFNFMLTATDGDQQSGDRQDKLRVRIWSDNNGLIYDNQLNAPDFADPTTALGGGNIVIHP